MATETSPSTAAAGDPLAVPSLAAAFQRTAAVDPDAVALRTIGGAVEISWRTYAERVRRIAAGLAALGVGRGDAVGLMLLNRPEFHLCDTAALHLGAVPFSIYNTSAPEQIAHLFANAGNRVVVCESLFLDRVQEARAATAVEHVICLDGDADGTLTLEQLEAMGRPEFDFDGAWRAVAGDDLLTLIYTSGTTGPPKGVELTHANLLAELRAATALLPLEFGDRAPSYLPSAHIADRWLSHYSAMAFGLQITCVPDPRAVAAALPDVRPTIWGAVPRVWEKIKAALEAKVEREPDAQRQQAMRWAIATGLRVVRAEQERIAGRGDGPDEALRAEHAKAEQLVLGPIRAAIGLDQVRWSVSGAAPIPPDVLEFFGAIGLPICELWGMSELSCCATINPPARVKIGTVGPALPGIELRLAEDGEVLVRGGTVMRGYRNEPGKTAEAIEDGWLRTGDIGTLDDEGYLRVVDRKKELMINAAGKNMSPANIELTLKAAGPLIGQAIAIGDARPYNVALLVLDPDAAAAYAADRGLADPSPAALAADPELVAAVAAEVERANERLSRVEQIKRFRILPVDWEPGGDELTPTSKLKRKPIAAKYAAEIEALYAD
ncbi:AMP-binding protein [Patulibacter defluvii]|uniref:AMP-binding protein n=1 Tax=Patulibacter defluvii TaxID=3095358 RepID=UPI002A7628CE|nr:AMP-binding protein [Patulibacter sp. DM4]